MTDQEKQIIEVFASDIPTFEAVQKVAKARIETERDLFIRNQALRKGKSPADIGSQVQIFDEALLLTEAVFADLRQFRRSEPHITKNPGR